jgi:two-component system phosphate regulon sensor histidine kinase PhoR
MKFSVLVFINALAVSVSLAVLNFYFQRSWSSLGITFAVSMVVSFTVFYYLMERYVYSKIKLIYKLIHNLKLGKDLKDALGGQIISSDPINDVQTEVKAWAKDKKVEIDTLRKQEAFRREFLTNISHEFKTPLFAVQGYIDAVIDDDLEDRELARRFLGKISANIDRLSYLVQDLDAISRLESGEIPVNYQRFDLSLLVKEVLESLEMTASKYKIDLCFKDKYSNPVIVNADREKIRQVLVNLVDNSLKYGIAGGTTAIKTFDLHDQVLVEVTDNGLGISEKDLPRLFERFYRTEKSRSREVGGSGLGLAIVKHIIEAHQQTISVRSTEGLGSTFAFTLEKVKQNFIPME